MPPRETVCHPLEPVFDSRSRVLILGTLPSPASRAGAFYYAHPQNRFWPVLASLFGEETPMGADVRRAFALRHRIALWDVLARCTIEGAGDASIRDPVPNDIAGLLSRTAIQTVFTTGRTAQGLYQTLCEEKTGLAAQPLPSSSPANRAMSTALLVERYRSILLCLNEEP